MSQYTKNFSSGWAQLILNVSEGSTSAANNTGVVSWSLQLKALDSLYSSSYTGISISVVLDGAARYSASSYSLPTLSKGAITTIASGSFTKSHASDGSMSMPVAAAFTTSLGIGSASISGTFIGVTIPRATQPTLPSSSIDLGNSVTINTPRAASSFTHTLAYSFGDASGTIATGVGTSYTWAVPLDLANQIPNSTSGTVKITCKTYNGSTLIGTKTVNLTVNVPSSVKPTISDISIAEAVQAVITKFGLSNKFVKTLSQLAVEIAINTDNAYGATVKNYSTQIDGIIYLGQQFTSNVLTTAGTLTVTATITDSRGRTSTYSTEITVIDYATPAVDILLAVSGTTVTATITGKVYDVDGTNTKLLILKYKKISDETYTEKTITLASADWEFTKSETVENIDNESTYEFIAVLTDKVTSSDDTATTGIVAISRRAGGKGVTFGGEAEQDGFVCKWESQFDSGLTAGAELDMTTDEIAEINTSIGTTGNRLANFLKSMAYKLGLIADYIVEQGTSGIWTYEKWNSGKAVCWGTKTGNLSRISTYFNFHLYAFTDVAFPSSLFIEPPKAFPKMRIGTSGGGTIDIRYNGDATITKDKMNVYGISETNATQACRADIYAIGRWK